MPSTNRQPNRRAVLGAGGVLGAVTLLAAGPERPAHADAGNFPFTETDEVALRADDPGLSDRARQLIRIGDVGIVQGDAAALDAFFHPDFRFHGPRGELDRQQLFDYFAACRAAFDSFAVTRQAIVSDGGLHLAARTRFAGVFARPFSGAGDPITPNGKPFEYRLINIFRYAPDGQLAEEWAQYDVQAFLDQLQSTFEPRTR